MAQGLTAAFYVALNSEKQQLFTFHISSEQDQESLLQTSDQYVFSRVPAVPHIEMTAHILIGFILQKWAPKTCESQRDVLIYGRCQNPKMPCRQGSSGNNGKTFERLSYCDRGKENRNFRLPFSIINMFHICPKDLDIRDEVEKPHSNQTAFHLWSCMIEHKQRMKFTCFGFLFDVFHLHLHSLFSPCVIFYLLFYLFCPCDRFSSSHL